MSYVESSFSTMLFGNARLSMGRCQGWLSIQIVSGARHGPPATYFYPPPDSARTVCQSVTAPSSKYTLNSAVLQGFFPPGGYNHTSTALPLCRMVFLQIGSPNTR